MNINETNQMKERIDGVLEAAKKFGNQAEQLNATRMTVSEFVRQAQEASQQLADLTTKVGKMIDETEELLNGRISAQIEPEVEKVHDVIDECRTYVSETTNQYQEAVKQLEASKEIFTEQHQKAEELLGKTVSDVSSALDRMTLTLDTKLEELSGKLSNLSDTLNKQSEENAKGLKKINDANEALTASVTELKDRQKKDAEEIKSLLASSSKKQTAIGIVGFVVVIALIVAFHFLK